MDQLHARLNALEQPIHTAPQQTSPVARRRHQCRRTAWGVVMLLGALGLSLGSATRAHVGPCVVLTGAGAQLLNGAVQGSEHESIVLEGTGGTPCGT